MFPSYRYIELFLEHLLEVTRYGCVFRNELVFPSKAREKHFFTAEYMCSSASCLTSQEEGLCLTCNDSCMYRIFCENYQR